LCGLCAGPCEWISLSILPSPIPELQHAPLPLQVLWARERIPTPPSSAVFHLDSHLSPSRSWECVIGTGVCMIIWIATCKSCYLVWLVANLGWHVTITSLKPSKVLWLFHVFFFIFGFHVYKSMGKSLNIFVGHVIECKKHKIFWKMKSPLLWVNFQITSSNFFLLILVILSRHLLGMTWIKKESFFVLPNALH
jgi:hypothetical protein